MRNVPARYCVVLVAASVAMSMTSLSYAQEILPKVRSVIEPADAHPRSDSADQSIKLRRSIIDNTSSMEVATSSALQQSFELRAAMLDDEAAKTDLLQSYAGFLPKVTGTARKTWNRSSVRTASIQTKGKARELNLGVNFSLPLLDGGKNLFSVKQFRAARNASKATVVATKNKVQLQVAQSYFAVSRDRRIERNLKKAVAAFSKISRITTARYRAGEASRTDIALANSGVRAMQAEYLSAKGIRQNSEVVFKSLTRADLNKNRKFHNGGAKLPASITRAKNLLVERNPVLISTFHQVDAARHQANVVRAGSLPQLSLVGGYTRDRVYGVGQNRETDWQIGFNLSVPLVDLENLARYKASKKRATANYYRALDLRRRLLAQLESDWNSYHATKAQRIAFKRQVKSLSRAIVGVNKEYSAGLRSITDVLNARINKVRAEIMLSRSEHDEKVMRQNILVAIGLYSHSHSRLAYK